jgi:hypothetical protein
MDKSRRYQRYTGSSHPFNQYGTFIMMGRDKSKKEILAAMQNELHVFDPLDSAQTECIIRAMPISECVTWKETHTLKNDNVTYVFKGFPVYLRRFMSHENGKQIMCLKHVKHRLKYSDASVLEFSSLEQNDMAIIRMCSQDGEVEIFMFARHTTADDLFKREYF